MSVRKTSEKIISVLVAEGRHELGHILVSRLEAEPDIRVVANVSRIEDAIDLAKRYRPQALIVDVAILLAGPPGQFDALAMASPGSRLILLVVDEDARTRQVATAAGAYAVISVLDDPDRLLATVRDNHGRLS